MRATDGEAELVDFAERIGLRREWLQRGRRVHFDLRPRSWRRARNAGALLVSTRSIARLEAVPICSLYSDCERASTLYVSYDLDLPDLGFCSREHAALFHVVYLVSRYGAG